MAHRAVVGPVHGSRLAFGPQPAVSRNRRCLRRVLIGGTFLVSPYMLNYDMLLLMPATLLLYEQGAKRGFLPLEPLVYAGLWLMPTLCMGLSRHHLPVASLAILAFGVAAVLQLRRETRIAS